MADSLNPGFGENGGGAAFGNPRLARQGATAAVSRATGTDARVTSTATPPKASAAPVAGKQNIFVGLTTALNEHQQELVKQRKRQVADQYTIEFVPSSLGASTVKRPGPQDSTTAPMQTPDSAAKLDPEKNSVNRDARTWPIQAGTQIIKVIDDVLRNSSYITEQQNVEISTAVDPTTGRQTQKLNPKNGGNMQWYKISVVAKQIGYDNIIRDHAYKISFIITPYAVAQMTSQYFPDSRYRGVHKAYQYWFTGANTQILNYEQKYNNAYRLVLSGIGADAQRQVTTDFRDQNRYIYMATSTNQATGAKNYANEPANNAASFLYDPTSLATAKLRIVGDPAWLQQGEVGLGVNARTFDFKPFNNDGSINYDSQAVMFSVAFNVPADYNLATGVVNVNTNNRNGQPQEYYTYQAIKCKSIFSKGSFTQELEGKLVIEKKINPTAGTGRSASAPSSVASADSRASPRIDSDQTAVDDGSRGYALTDETGQTSNLRLNEYGDLYDPTGLGTPAPQPSPPPQPPTSSGEIDYSAGLAGSDQGAATISAPPDASIANSPNDGVQEKLARAADYDQRAAAARAAGDVYNATTLDRLAAQSRANAAADAKYGAPPQVRNTQLIARDDS